MAMAAEGARVLVNDIDVEEAQGVAREIREAGGEAAADGGSVARWDEARGVVEHCVGEYGGLDVLVNNAGLYRVAPLWEATEEELDAIIAVNVKGVFRHGPSRRRGDDSPAAGVHPQHHVRGAGRPGRGARSTPRAREASPG